MKPGYKESSDHLRAGWIQEAKGDVMVVWLKRSGAASATEYTTQDYSTAQQWINEFVSTGKHPDYDRLS